MMITELANNPSVSLSETVTSARHSNLTSSLNYQHRDGESEAAKFAALGMAAASASDGVAEKPLKDDTSEGLLFVCFCFLCCLFVFF